VYDVVVKSSRSLSHLLMSFLFKVVVSILVTVTRACRSFLRFSNFVDTDYSLFESVNEKL